MLIGWKLWMLAALLTAGVLLDHWWGEVRRWHPLVGFGRLANAIERALNRWPARGVIGRIAGLLAWMLAVMPLVLLATWLCSLHAMAGLLLHVLLLYFSLGLRSLQEHTQPIAQALQQGDLDSARELTARIVSRDTVQADETDLAKAGVESLLENGNDAVFGTLFWFAVAGGPGALLFRLANTLDAMWGYRTPRWRCFGWAAARIDDAFNFVPARLTAVSYALLGNSRRAWRCWRTQAPAWSSPNAGPVMASGAGALGLALGGSARYHGVLEQRPPLGSGRPAEARDIGRAWRLVFGTTMLWLGVAWLVALMQGIFHA